MPKVSSRPGLLTARSWRGGLFYGHWVGGEEEPLRVTEPATGEILAEVGSAGEADVEAAVRSATAAQVDWAAAPPRARAVVLRKAARVLEAAGRDLEDWVVRETGGVRSKAAMEIGQGAEELEAAAAFAMQPLGELLPSEFGEDLSFARRVPHGVVTVITPWNVPLLLGLRSVAPALAAGNAVVLKPDEHTPVSGGIVVARALEEAGLPPGVLAVLPGGPAVGEALVTHPEVAMISFTGSTVVGREIAERAGTGLKKVALELGGNSPLVVLEDADLDAATSGAAWASFSHQGQTCMAAGRHVVHERVAEEFLERLSAKAKALPVGDPYREEVALGPLIDAEQLGRVTAIVEEAVGAGAEVRAGGTPDAPYYPPTVLGQVRPGMRAFDEEIFGPVAPVIAFGDDEEALALAAAGSYGLSAAVHSRDLARAQRIGSRLPVGMVHINGQTVNDSPYIPFGGRGSSGNGSRFGSVGNAETFQQVQWMTIRKLPDRGGFAEF